ncbi:MAG: hypothetical protein ACF8XB_22020 [Planctomycetota bacterium JB042]
MTAEHDALRESLKLLAGKEARFAELLADDLRRSHPDVLDGRESLPGPAVKAALERFSVTTGEGDPAESPGEDVVQLADSLMKVFARVLGRAAWKPAMALAWNAALRRDGETLLEELRGLD